MAELLAAQPVIENGRIAFWQQIWTWVGALHCTGLHCTDLDSWVHCAALQWTWVHCADLDPGALATGRAGRRVQRRLT